MGGEGDVWGGEGGWLTRVLIASCYRSEPVICNQISMIIFCSSRDHLTGFRYFSGTFT